MNCAEQHINCTQRCIEGRENMKYIDLCGMKMSQIVLGTDGYGERISEATARELMTEYIKCGGNVIDTARLYCGGKSEEIIGRYLADTGLRDKVYISTKCSHPPLGHMEISRLDRESIEYDVEKSLDALGIDTIDILWLHRDDISKPVEPIIDALNDIADSGRVKRVKNFGASNWSFERIAEANEYAKSVGKRGFMASQALYNMATCSKVWDNTLAVIEGGEKKKYDESHFPVFAFCSQAKGFFEKYHDGKLSEKAKERYLNAESLKTYEKIFSRAQNEKKSISCTALGMLSEQSDFDVFPIIGPTGVGQLRQTILSEDNR